ncbi:MAG TPA: FliG C-terminal domain-containing protein [Gemmataceae bacterium]|nr:FliG C-terminal domain-containing protein [Gemmataceae bacterium]
MATITGEDKAVLLLTSLSPTLVETILSRLDPERSGRLRGKLQRGATQQASDEIVAQVLADFERMLRRSAAEPANILPMRPPTNKPAPPPPQAPEPLPAVETVADPVAALRSLDVPQLAAALAGEQGRTVALVLDCLDAEPAGEILKRLTPELRRDASVHLGRAPTVSMPLLQRVARALLQKCRAMNAGPAVQNGDARFRKMADMLRLLDKTERMEVLSAIEQQDSQVAAMIKDLLYQFEDLLLIEDRSMQKLLAEIDSKALATALKGAPDEIKDKVTANLSKRARDTLMEEMEFLGFIPASQAAQAQKTVVAAIQRLDQAGELVMKE